VNGIYLTGLRLKQGELALLLELRAGLFIE
jgi:hypothetical protein